MKHTTIRRAALLAMATTAVLGVAACVPDPGTGGGTTTTTSTTTTTTTPISELGPDCEPPSFHPGANFGRGCSLAGLTLEGVDLSPNEKGVTTYGPFTNLEKATVSGSNLDFANFKYSSAPGATFVKSSMVGIVLIGSSERELSNLTGTQWISVDASKADLQFADLSGSSLVDVRLGGANLAGSVWRDARLDGVTLDDSTVCPDGIAFNEKELCRGSLPGL